jgi:hypothetical protein
MDGLCKTLFLVIGVIMFFAMCDLKPICATTQGEPGGGHPPPCLEWRKVKQGETAWSIAREYCIQKNIRLWIINMRKASRLSINSDYLPACENICVRWVE